MFHQPSRALDGSQSPFARNAPLTKVSALHSSGLPPGPSGDDAVNSARVHGSNPDPRISACETLMRFSASPRPRRPTRSARPTESWPRSCIRTSTRATSAPRSSSRRFPPPTICCRIRTSDGATTRARSTPRGRKRRRRKAILSRLCGRERPSLRERRRATPTSRKATTSSPNSCGEAASRRGGPGADLHYELHVPFLEAVNGATKTITLPGGGTLAGVDPARGRGRADSAPARQGRALRGEGPPGDALVQIVVEPHRYFTRDGDDIHLELPITVKEAALGGEVRAPTTTGSVMLKIPKRLQHRRHAASEGQGREGPRPRGRRTRQAQGRDADGAGSRARGVPRQMDARPRLRSPQGDVTHDQRAGVSRARASRSRHARNLDPGGMARPEPHCADGLSPRWTSRGRASSTI